MSDKPDEQKTTLSIEEAARNLVNAIADCIHSTLQARDAILAEKVRQTPQEGTVEVTQSEEYNTEDAQAQKEYYEELEERTRATRRAAIAAREREEAEERAAKEAIAQAALEAVERQVPLGTRVSFAGQGRGRTYGEGALPQSQFYIRGAKISFPDSLRTAVATIFRDEPAVETLFDLTLNGDNSVRYRAERQIRTDARQIILKCNVFSQEIVMSIDDLAEAELPM